MDNKKPGFARNERPKVGRLAHQLKLKYLASFDDKLGTPLFSGRRAAKVSEQPSIKLNTSSVRIRYGTTSSAIRDRDVLVLQIHIKYPGHSTTGHSSLKETRMCSNCDTTSSVVR